MRRRACLTLLATSPLALAACGGNDARPSTASTVAPGTSVPASATTTATAAASTIPTAGTANATATRAATAAVRYGMEVFPVVAGSRPHDVAPAADGTVWYTGQGNGTLGRFNPSDGVTTEIPLGRGSAPHGVIVGPDGDPWVTDGGLNAIVHHSVKTAANTVMTVGRSGTNLNTCAFDGRGILWFTGQTGIYGRANPATGKVEVFDAPRGSGPYGICATPAGEIYYASLAGNHIARIDLTSGAATPIDPPTARQGARRVWADSSGRIWVSCWNTGEVAVFDPKTSAWRQWKLPGSRPQAYAVYVDDRETVWLTDFGANAIVRFDPASEEFTGFPLPRANAAVRQLLGRAGEVWGAQSGLDSLVVIREG